MGKEGEKSVNWDVVIVPRSRVQKIVERATEKAEQSIIELGFDIDHSASPLGFDVRNEH